MDEEEKKRAAAAMQAELYSEKVTIVSAVDINKYLAALDRIRVLEKKIKSLKELLED
jgi:hypothetical protein